MKNKKLISGILLLILLLLSIVILVFITNQKNIDTNNNVETESFEQNSEEFDNDRDITVEVKDLDALFLENEDLPNGYTITDLGNDIGEFKKVGGQYEFKRENLCNESSWEKHEACTYFTKSYIQFISNGNTRTTVSVIYNTTSESDAGKALEQKTIEGRERDNSFGLTCIPGGKIRSEAYDVFISVDMQEGDDINATLEILDSIIRKGNFILMVDCRDN